MNEHRSVPLRLLALAASAALAPALPTPVRAQSAPAVAEPVAVEILMEVTAEGARCRPPEARLPAASPVQIRLVNPSASPIRFMATTFLQLSEVTGSSGAVEEGAGFLVGPGVTARIALARTPGEGRHPFTCAIEQAGRMVEGTGGVLEIVPRPAIPFR